MAEMAKLMALDFLDGKIDRKSIILSRVYLTRALETFWDQFFNVFVCLLSL